MGARRLIWRLYPAIFFASALMLAAVTWFSSRSIRQFYVGESEYDLESRARIVRHAVEPAIESSDFSGIDSLCKNLGRAGRARVTVVLPSGVVIADSEENPAGMQNHSDRPEIVEAMKGRTGRSIRYSSTLKQNTMYVAVPVWTEERVSAVVRTAVPLRSVDRALGRVYRHIVLGILMLAVAAALVSYVLARQITQPIEQITRGAEKYAEGDFRAPLPAADSEEIAGLVAALRTMAAQLNDRLATLARQRNEQQAVLASMVESVVAIDTDERVIILNRAAEELFGIDHAKAHGRRLQEVIRNSEVQRHAAAALATDRPVEGEIQLLDPEERVLQVHGTALHDAQGEEIGALLVLYDITNLRRLERVRRDFVANVSHELKTPITAIKGFVETLLAGAVHSPQDAERFLGIIAKNIERLDSIIEDLLALSRLEQDKEGTEIAMERRRVADAVHSAAEFCRPMARSRSIDIRVTTDDALECNVNWRLIEQAVVNLIDNAIKFSPPGSTIDVSASHVQPEVVISVEDRGCGIEKRHLPRLFERFYRTDRARSREMGGTGLGLAIVKHVALVHGGRVGVESEVGKGSVFSIYLPA